MSDQPTTRISTTQRTNPLPRPLPGSASDPVEAFAAYCAAHLLDPISTEAYRTTRLELAAAAVEHLEVTRPNLSDQQRWLMLHHAVAAAEDRVQPTGVIDPLGELFAFEERALTEPYTTAQRDQRLTLTQDALSALGDLHPDDTIDRLVQRLIGARLTWRHSQRLS